PGDVSALSERLEAAAAGARPSREHTRTWAGRYDWSRVVDAHRGLYRRTLKKTSGTERPPRVVYLDHVARLSGGEIALQRLLAALDDSVDAHVVLGEEGPLVNRLIEQGISVEVLPMSSAARNVRKDNVRPHPLPIAAMAATVLYVIRLAWRLRRLRPDLVHTNSLKAGIYGGLAAHLGGIPVVWHVRDRIDTDYLPRFAVMMVRRMIRRFADVVITNSQATMNSLGGKQRSSHIVYSVVPEVANIVTHESRPGSADHGLCVGIVGRLAPWKGQHLFLEAFAEAFPHGPHRGVVVGTALFGEDAYEESLHQTAARLGLLDRVEFRGFRENVMAELAQLDILVHASITPEPFGQVILEGMAAGLPVLASEGGGPSEIITDGVDGILYPRADAHALAAHLRELALDEDRRSALGIAARRRSLDYAPAVVARRMMDAYKAATQVAVE
ncbi:MAG: glycosyltransferase family 4 protein, partial [Actinomycetota bacterium]|nr:glycosyltransferase family 4 protein [Actinomycetota bacterium]